ncbi:MAG TPA: carbohydrate-binding protein, partial [Ktedonobacteraceae bacterium]|nr:carbohydrate-binding protein [Ktedonobacteraceae bacterium]
LWPILSGERGIYSIADGGSGEAALSAMLASANSSGFIPEQIWANPAPSGYTAGTPTKSMMPLNWAMGEYITLLFSASQNCIADVAAIVYDRYVGTTPCGGSTGGGSGGTPPAGVSISPNPALAGHSATITYNGTLASSATSITMHWGYNSWNGITDTAMSQQSDGTWQATITVPSGATTLNMAFKNQSSTWDNNGGSNYNFSVTTATATPTPTPTATSTPTPTPTATPAGGTTCTAGSVSASTCPLVAGASGTIVYAGSLASGATSLMMHWGYNNWTGTTDTTMTKQSNGTWTATITVPAGATVINTAYKNQSGTWDNNGSSNYNLPVGSCFVRAVSTASCPTIPGTSITIVYAGSLASGATSLTMHWGYNNWTGTTDTTMTKQSNGTWTATITVPAGATTLNMAFKNQSSTWDNNGSSNYNLNA